MKNQLSGKRIAILATDGFEQVELADPKKAVEDHGAKTDIISLKTGKIRGFNHMEEGDEFDVDKAINDVSANDYDGLILPGGVHNPDTLRTNKKAVQFVKDFFKQKKPVSAICHGPWLLVEADVVRNRKVTSWPSVKTDLTNAGAIWTDEEVVVDEGLTTSRKPEDLDAFCRKTIEEFCESKHERQVA